jgi:hypothetical protein
MEAPPLPNGNEANGWIRGSSAPPCAMVETSCPKPPSLTPVPPPSCAMVAPLPTSKLHHLQNAQWQTVEFFSMYLVHYINQFFLGLFFREAINKNSYYLFMKLIPSNDGIILEAQLIIEIN